MLYKNLKTKQGLSLVELIVVIAIIAILVVLLFPVFSKAKKSAKSSSCLNNMRQIFISHSLYTDENGGEPPTLLALLTTKKADPGIVLCPDDPEKGYFTKTEACKRVPIPYEASYEYYRTSLPRSAITRLESVDSNHGIFACRCHGERHADYNYGQNFCTDAQFRFFGKLHRLRKDGSVHVDQFLPIPPRQGRHELFTSSAFKLYTDEKDPDSPFEK